MSFTSLTISCPEEFIEIMMAELAELGFSTFQENDDASGFSAFAEPHEPIDEQEIKALFERYQKMASMEWELGKVEKENWNADWEKNYDPIKVAGKILVRASFHEPDSDFPIEIIVTPKMSFGTGHHETTYQMLAMMDDMEWKNKHVLDAGCGTGILAIMAHKKGAQAIEAYDIDEWAVENTIENFGLNHLSSNQYTIWQGEVDSIKEKQPFDAILANINKNILLHDIPFFAPKIKEDGYLMLSGFYQEDVKDIEAMCKDHGLRKKQQSIKNNWIALLLQKAE